MDGAQQNVRAWAAHFTVNYVRKSVKFKKGERCAVESVGLLTGNGMRAALNYRPFIVWYAERQLIDDAVEKFRTDLAICEQRWCSYRLSHLTGKNSSGPLSGGVCLVGRDVIPVHLLVGIRSAFVGAGAADPVHEQRYADVDIADFQCFSSRADAPAKGLRLLLEHQSKFP